MLNLPFILLSCSLLIYGCCNVNPPSGNSVLDYEKINNAAARQYLEPIRPGYEGRNPFWNRFATKFIYAPAFDFPQNDRAVKYRFTIRQLDGGSSWSFIAETPTAPLSPVWNGIPVGQVLLTVEGIDADGKSIGEVGRREFFRDFPFRGPYKPAVRGYRQAARMAMLATHNMVQIQHWAENTEPDMSYQHHTYPCKIIGATIRSELLLAQELPAYRDRAVAIAGNAARFLISQSRPEGEPLAYFPPTYYKGLIASKRAENQNKTMTMEAVAAGQAFLDLFDMTGETCYYDQALGIADTYVKIQRPDGSYPIKVDFLTGEPVNDACAMLHPLLEYFQRLHTEYGATDYLEAQRKAEMWMRENALRRFDFTGQFEDNRIMGLQPYENLTNCTAAPYASYLLTKEQPSGQEIADAVDLIRFSEDQFTCWEAVPNADGIDPINTPCVLEQYKYRVPVDNSACNVADAFINLYQKTGDKIALAKAIALINNITVTQNAVNGFTPTTWDFCTPDNTGQRTYWINCSYSTVCSLFKLDDLLSHNPPEEGKIR